MGIGSGLRSKKGEEDKEDWQKMIEAGGAVSSNQKKNKAEQRVALGSVGAKQPHELSPSSSAFNMQKQ